MLRNSFLAAAVAVALMPTISGAGSFTGPSSSQSPYVTPTAPGWDVTALLTVGDLAEESPYAMVGIPDGLGAVAGKFAENGDYVADKAFMTVFMNHELGSGSGIPRTHGARGAFVSQWTVHLNSLQVKWGEDLIRRVYTWDSVDGTYADTTGAAVFNRFCSADLPAPAAFFNPATGKGFDGRIFMNGEEAGSEGRAFAHILSGAERGTAYQLPYLGRFSWENSVAHPNAGDRTLVIGLDDSSPGQVYVYLGDKRADGSPVEKAGLHGGKLFGVKVPEVALEIGAINGEFQLVDLSAYATGTGAALQAQSVTAGVTEFARPEDGHWDTRNPNAFYFATTGRTGSSARLYRLTFDSITNPTAGTVEMVVDSAALTGTDGQTARSFDNLTVDADGNVLLQEDPGGNAYVAKTWKIDTSKSLGQAGFAVQVFESDRARFAAGAPGLLTIDEENSGVIEVTDQVRTARWFQAGRRYYLGVTQAHYGIAGELVEGGQLYLMASPIR